ncbi:LRRN4 C-terminal-like protein [Pleurodeles waltl]|uniref:LRRN4 C-terminal-like protein n=1 Tax=Pleurodeles waltl TaxID=8319 RepID=UPI0037099535
MESIRKAILWAHIAALSLLLFGLMSAVSQPTDGNTTSSTPLSTHQDSDGPTKELHITLPKSTATTSRSLHNTLTRIHFAIPDYEEYDYPTDDEDEVPSMAATTRTPAVPCDYDRCRHLQVPCDELQQLSRCLCPGVSGTHVRPDPPRLGDIQESEGVLTVHWCSPSSTVDQYHIEVRRDDNLETLSSVTVNSTHRLTTLESLQSGKNYVVCVVAVNQAGSSEVNQAEYGPCREVQMSGSQLRYLYIALGASAAALLLVGILGIACYYHSRRKKSLLHSSRDTTMPSGVPNMSYRSESIEQL